MKELNSRNNAITILGALLKQGNYLARERGHSKNIVFIDERFLLDLDFRDEIIIRFDNVTRNYTITLEEHNYEQENNPA